MSASSGWLGDDADVDVVPVAQARDVQATPVHEHTAPVGTMRGPDEKAVVRRLG